MRRILLALLTLGLLLGVVSPVANATTTLPQPKNKGLYISPLRTYLTLSAGESATRAFTVANLTDQPITVTAHIEQFSVADYTYDYTFQRVDNDWVTLNETSVSLQPNESHALAYRITLPKNAAPGGHYYTLYASSTVESGSSKSIVQAATLLYLTVGGELTRTSAIMHRSLPSIVVTPQITYSLDVRNTGNTHYFAYFAATVDGLFYHNAPNGNSQLLMPDTTRRIENTISSPLIPGIYKLGYTYTPDQGSTITGSQYFLFLPPWSIALLIILLAVLAHYLTRRYKRKK